jgi:hypothetical protein
MLFLRPNHAVPQSLFQVIFKAIIDVIPTKEERRISKWVNLQDITFRCRKIKAFNELHELQVKKMVEELVRRGDILKMTNLYEKCDDKCGTHQRREKAASSSSSSSSSSTAS